MQKIFLLITILVITAACSKKLKETVGISTTGPNEYQVQRTKGLEIPPHYYLPEPNTSQSTIKGYAEFDEGEKALMQDMN